MQSGRRETEGETHPPSLPTRIRKVLGRIRRSVSVDTFDVFNKPVPASDEFEPPSGYRFRWGTQEEIHACDPYHTELDERERREGAARLELGHRVVLGLEGDQVVFTMWANPRNLNVPGLVKRRLAPDQWFIYKAYTSPDHRGRGLYGAGMRFVLAEMAREGKRRLVGYAHVKKRVSRKGLARLEFESAGRLVCVTVPGWSRTFTSRELARAFPEALPRSHALEGLETRPRTT